MVVELVNTFSRSGLGVICALRPALLSSRAGGDLGQRDLIGTAANTGQERGFELEHDLSECVGHAITNNGRASRPRCRYP